MVEKQDVYSIVTDKILTALENGTVPWKKPWTGSDSLGAFALPRNAISNRKYSGINVWLLYMTTLDKGYTDNRWLTYKQAQNAGGSVSKGEKSTLIIFWSIIPRKEKNPHSGEVEIRNVGFLRYYYVFNVAQCEGLNIKPIEAPVAAPEGIVFTPIEAAQSVIDSWEKKPPITHDGGDRAYYIPSLDTIHLPKPESFRSIEEYYSTAFHELGHSTGHTSRLNRLGEYKPVVFSDSDYSKEELVAEFCSAFLCATVGIDNTLENSAAYIANWHKKLKSEPKLVVYAAAQGNKAASLILGESAEAEIEREEIVAA